MGRCVKRYDAENEHARGMRDCHDCAQVNGVGNAAARAGKVRRDDSLAVARGKCMGGPEHECDCQRTGQDERIAGPGEKRLEATHSDSQPPNYCLPAFSNSTLERGVPQQ
jgi:hypothetical protein